MRAGLAIRQQMRMDAWRCPNCGHADNHLEKPYGSEGYAPLVSHCTRDGCECVLDLNQQQAASA